ncbi:MAG TPA: hypothetical protein VKB91_10010 [Gemmatimonadaceae bacterium]|nr:hypothetical protein [Gemmatimonadaceae bacterium]
MLEPFVTAIEVPCGQEQAFKVFVHDMGTWWPLNKRSMSMHKGKPAESLSIEPRVGGKIVEHGHDDTLYHWGTIESYDPYNSVGMSFHMGLPPSKASRVDVRFTPLQKNRTRVELTQSNWEGFGDMAEMMRGSYPAGWVIIFEQAYGAACGG